MSLPWVYQAKLVVNNSETILKKGTTANSIVVQFSAFYQTDKIINICVLTLTA